MAPEEVNSGYPVFAYALVSDHFAGDLQKEVFEALSENRIDDVERLLDLIEDYALQVKREAW